MAPAFESQNSRRRRLRYELKKIAALTLLFGGLFAASYYAVNLLDIKSKPEVANSTLVAASASDLKAGDKNLADRIGSSDVSLAGFADWADANNLSSEDRYNADADNDGLVNYLEYIHGTDPNNADSDGDKFSDLQEIKNGYDPDAPGDAMTKVTIRIDKLNVEAPVVWSKTDNEADQLKDLENGVSHFLGTASPGQSGNSIISGHSSNYIWSKGSYNYIFRNLNDLEKGDVVTIKTIQKNGRIMVYKYKINDKFIASPTEERIFAETENPTLTLSTCWPLGTNFKRMIVKAELL